MADDPGLCTSCPRGCVTATRRSVVRRLVLCGATASLLALWPAPVVTSPQTSAAAAPPAARMSRDWKQLQSPHFVVSGNSTESVLRTTAAELETFRATVSSLFPAARGRSPRPTQVVVFRNDAAFHEFKPRDPRGRVMDTVAGYLTTRVDATYIVLAARTNPTQTVRVVLHEFAHDLIHGFAPRVPRWLDEGLADFYSTIQFESLDGGIQIGEPIRGHQVRLRGGLIIPLDRLLSAQGETTIFGDMRQQLVFYAQSWALVHYLTLGHGGKREGQMEEYLRAIAAGQNLADSWRQAFGSDLRSLHLELATYVRRSILPTRSLTRPTSAPVDASRRAAPMSEAGVQALRADLMKRVPVFGETGEAETREPASTHPPPTGAPPEPGRVDEP